MICRVRICPTPGFLVWPLVARAREGHPWLEAINSIIWWHQFSNVLLVLKYGFFSRSFFLTFFPSGGKMGLYVSIRSQQPVSIPGKLNWLSLFRYMLLTMPAGVLFLVLPHTQMRAKHSGNNSYLCFLNSYMIISMFIDAHNMLREV